MPVPARDYGDARQQYLEQYGSALVTNTYLRIALLSVSLVAAVLLFLNIRSSADEKRQESEYSPGRNVQVNRRRGPSRELVRGRDRDYEVRSRDLETMEEIGKFRTVAVDDLGRFHYQGNVSRMKYELRALEVNTGSSGAGR